MLLRVIAVDPDPREDPRKETNDLLTYHVPENSRQLELLLQMLKAGRIEHVVIDTNGKVLKRQAKKGRRMR